jgi:integrase
MSRNEGVNTRIINLLIQAKNLGQPDTTLRTYASHLKTLANNADINNPETVNTYLRNLQRSNTYKKNICKTYAKYCKIFNIQWNRPKYESDTKMIKIPTKERIEMLIASAGKQLALKLRIIMEVGVRPIELLSLKVKDVDLEQRLLYPTTAKHGARRTIKFSNQLEALLRQHIIENKLNLTDKMFNGKPHTLGSNFREMRDNLAKKLNDPTLRNIRLYDLRHYFATMLYNKTKDIILVKTLMGHKDWNTTQKYVHLLKILEMIKEDEWVCKTATNVEEAKQLIEHGFEYITDMDELKLFRKRK